MSPVPLRLAAAGLLLPLALSACSDAPGDTAGTADAGDTRTVQTARGPVEVPSDPQRVVVLDLGELDSAIALGVTPVGAVRAPVEQGLLSYLEDQVDGVELVGEIGAPDLEAIAALDPDLILGSEVRVADSYDQLSALAPTVLTESVGAAWKDNLLVHAEALGEAERAEQLLADYQARADEVGDAVADGTTVSVVRFVPGEIRLYARESFVGTVLSDAGIARPAAQDVADFSVTLSPEDVTAADGDLVVVGTYGDPAETDAPAVTGGPLWQRLGAVSAGRVLEVDDDVWFLGTGVGAAALVLDELEGALA